MKLLLFCFAVFVTCQIPIPRRPHGTSFGRKDAPVTFEVFVSLPCTDTTKFWREAGKQIIQDYVNTGKVQLLIHQFPLPYFSGSWESSKAANIVHKYQPSRTLQFIEYTLENQDKIFNRALLNKTQLEFRDIIYLEYVRRFDISKEVYDKEMGDVGILLALRDQWKYATERAITGTPDFLVNGVHYRLSNYDYEGFKKLFDSLI